MVKSLPYLFTDNYAHDLLQYTVLIEKKMKYCAILAARLPLPLPNCQKMLSMDARACRKDLSRLFAFSAKFKLFYLYKDITIATNIHE